MTSPIGPEIPGFCPEKFRPESTCRINKEKPMRNPNKFNVLRRLPFVIGGFLLGALSAIAQEPTSMPAPSASAAQSNDVRALAESLLELKAQMQAMTARVEALQKEQARSQDESRELRRKLEQAEKNLNAQAGGGFGYAPSTRPAQSVSGAPAQTP
jgi:septal ring factor EnvC (AmiA/AmiB activator)